MFEFVRYTILVLLGLASMVALFISLAITGTVIAQTGEFEAGNNYYATFWTLGLSAIIGCLWLSNAFVRQVPRTILNWIAVNKDHITTYCVVTVIFFVFVVS